MDFLVHPFIWHNLLIGFLVLASGMGLFLGCGLRERFDTFGLCFGFFFGIVTRHSLNSMGLKEI